VITAPIGNVTVQPGEAVSFAGSTSDPDGDPVTVLWSFGDGATSTQLVPGAHAYTTAGSYTVTLTATDSHAVPDPTPDTRLITVGESQAVRTTGVVAGVANVHGLFGSDWHTTSSCQRRRSARWFSPTAPGSGTVNPLQGASSA
jgi:PKD repeat protein